MNSLELAYTVQILRRLTESAKGYTNSIAWYEDLEHDLKQAQTLLRVYDKRLATQNKKGALA